MTRPLSGGRAGGDPGAGSPLALGGDLAGTTAAARVTNVGLTNIVTDYAEFIAAPNVSSAAGVHTVLGRIEGEGAMVLPAGESIVYSETGILTSNAHASWHIFGDFDGPLLSGPVSASYLEVTNASLGASSFCMEITSTLGRLAQLDYVGVFGIRGIHVKDVTGVLNCRTAGTLSANSIVGFLISGITGALFFQNCGVTVSESVPSVLFEIDDTAIVSGIIQIAAPIMLTPVVQHAVAVSTSAVFGPGAFLQITGGGASGPQNKFFRQEVGDRLATDPAIVVKGVASSPNWGASSDAQRLDLANPLTVVLPAAPSDAVAVPYKDGVNPLEVEALSQVRFSLSKDPGDPNRWWEQYDGPIPDVAATATWNLFFARVGGGTGLATACVARNAAIDLPSVQQDDGGVFTNFTAEAVNGTIGDVPLTPDPLAIGDATYYGSAAPFETLTIEISQSGVGTYTVVYEYWNGAAFVAAVGLVDGTSGYTAAPGRYDVDHTPQPGWASTTINGVAAFYLRSRVTVDTSLTTQPLATMVRSYAGFAPVVSTVGGIEARSLTQNAEKTGSVNINPGDRFHPEIQNQAAGQSVDILDVSQNVRVIA